jgi:hypothetical protein
MRSRPPLKGNASGVARENLPVHAIAELMDVVQDLCRYAAIALVAGQHAWAETIVEQCADLLAHRASVLARARETAQPHHRHADGLAALSPWGTKWTN